MPKNESHAGISFKLSVEQEMLQSLAREFARKEIRPISSHHDHSGEFPIEVLKKAWEQGLMNTHIPEAYGGMGLGVLDGVLLAMLNPGQVVSARLGATERRKDQR